MSKANKKKNKGYDKTLGGSLSDNLKGLLRKGLASIALVIKGNKQKNMHMVVLVCKSKDSNSVDSMDAMFVRASAGTMVGMLYAAGQKDMNFAKAIVTASQGLIFDNEELRDMRDKMLQIEESVTKAGNGENNIQIPSEDDVNNMTQEDMDDYIKRMLGGKKSQGEA